MAKFIIECPQCGAYHEASTGFFASKELKCSCGNTINIKKDRFIVKECAHCGNSVMFDQRKGDDAICPVCKSPILTSLDRNNYRDISCPSCSCEIKVHKSALEYTCPLCKTTIDVQAQIAKAELKKNGLASVIKYEGPSDVIVWKHPIDDFNMGSQLIVHETQEAIFFKDGQALDLFGAGRYTLATENVPLLQNLYKLPFDSNALFHSEVYFINLITQTGIKWGTPSKVRMFDPYSGLSVELGAYGEFSFKVINSRKLLLKLVGTTNNLTTNDLVGDPYSIKSISGKFKALVITKVKSILTKHIKDNNINILEVDEHLEELSQSMREEINNELEQYGVTIPEFYVLHVVTPDDDPNFARLKAQYAEQYLLVKDEQIKKNVALAAQQRKIVEAQTSAQEEIIAAQAKAEAHRLQAQAEAQEMQMKGYTYQDQTRRQVGVAAMENQPQNGGIASGVIGDIVGLGVTMGAVNQFVDVAKGIATPQVKAEANTWTCPNCKTEGITSKFCPNCGEKKQEEPKGWTCTNCGNTNILSNFCPECGSRKPEVKLTWDCQCGQKDITSNFCPNCGNKRI